MYNVFLLIILTRNLRSKSMKILAFDTALNSCSVAVSEEKNILATDSMSMERGQAEALFPMIEKVMKQAKTSYQDIDIIAVTKGPGSFTGIRTGLSAAKAIGMAGAMPVCGVSTTEAVACAVPKNEKKNGCNILVALETKRSDIYFQLFSCNLEPLSKAMAIMPEEIAELILAPAIIVGDGSKRLFQELQKKKLPIELSQASGVPNAVAIAKIASRYKPEEITERPSPLYLRAPTVKI